MPKAPLYDRLRNVFGRSDVLKAIDSLIRSGDIDPLTFLTPEAKQAVLDRMIRDHKLHRRMAAQSRAHYAAQQKAKLDV